MGVGKNESESTLGVRVRDWLRGQGYPLEMRVAQCFMDAGFDVIQSAVYEDPQEGKSREIDVRTQYWAPIHKGDFQSFVTVGCDIECKLSADKPWVLLLPNEEDEEPDEEELLPWFKPECWVSYS